MKSKLWPTLFLIVVIVTACKQGNGEGFSKNNLQFPKSLLAYGLFKGKISELQPTDSVQELQLSSTLFTDYTEKQRLIKLPKGTTMTAHGDGLPDFPEGTVLAKTFYYSAQQTGNSKRIIETRILIKNKGLWNVATYQWNEAQTDALLLNDGATVNISITTPNGKQRDIGYKIPTVYECYDCHRTAKAVTPIGPKLRNLNRTVGINRRPLNQLDYLSQEGLLDIKGHQNIAQLPDYKNTALSTEHRARAYFEMNCAHCHNPDGFAGSYSLNLHYEVEFKNTGITFNKWNINHRMAIKDMPKLGTTIVDDEGLKLIQEYLKTLDQK